jgi:predicted DNA binding CopG/RHH family protein
MEEEMKEKIPDTDSIEELARFWDAHDVTDFEEELEIVSEPVFQRDTETVTVPLGAQDVQAVRRIAELRGVDYVVLIQEWVLEKLHAS